MPFAQPSRLASLRRELHESAAYLKRMCERRWPQINRKGVRVLLQQPLAFAMTLSKPIQVSYRKQTLTRPLQKRRERFFAEEEARLLGQNWNFGEDREHPDFVVDE